MYIYIYLYIHIFAYLKFYMFHFYTYTKSYIRIFIYSYIRIIVYLYIHVLIYLYVDILIYSHIRKLIIHIFIYWYVFIFISSYTLIFKKSNFSSCIFTDIHVYRYAYIHIYIYISIYYITISLRPYCKAVRPGSGSLCGVWVRDIDIQVLYYCCDMTGIFWHLKDLGSKSCRRVLSTRGGQRPSAGPKWFKKHVREHAISINYFAPACCRQNIFTRWFNRQGSACPENWQGAEVVEMELVVESRFTQASHWNFALPCLATKKGWTDSSPLQKHATCLLSFT